jgi:hypothetical protein
MDNLFTNLNRAGLFAESARFAGNSSAGFSKRK